MRKARGILIEPRPSGQFLARVRYKGTYRSKAWPTEQAAMDWALSEQAKQTLGLANQTGVLPTGYWIDRYMAENRRRKRAEGHLVEVERILKLAATAVPDLADPRAGRLARVWLQGLAGLAPATINRHLAILRAYTRFLVMEELITRDPFAVVGRVKQPKRVKAVFSIDELQRMLALTTHRWHPYLVLAVYHGLRASEVATWERVGTTIIVRQGKGQKDRIVPLQAEAKAWVGEIPPEPLTHWANRAGLESIAKAAKVVVGDRSPHSLRHTWCALLCASGENLAIVKAWAGHVAITTTAGYAELAAAFPEAREWKRGVLQIVGNLTVRKNEQIDKMP